MKSEKRPFNRLTDGEKEALRKLDEASHSGTNARGVTATGPCDLARKLTPEKKLTATDPISMDYIHLINEGWIVLPHSNSFDRICLYRVSDDYAAQLVDHS